MELARGNVAVVTGAASGIGFALAERFATAGLNIVLADVQDDALATAADKIGAHGVETLTVRTDVSKEAEVQALAAATIERFGAVHVALTEDLYNTVKVASLPIGVSVLCPGWVNTKIVDADRNWPASLGAKPDDDAAFAVMLTHAKRAIAEGVTPASIADAVADAVLADRFWVIPQQEFLDLVVERWESIAERLDPDPPENVPGMPPRSQIIEEVLRALSTG